MGSILVLHMELLLEGGSNAGYLGNDTIITPDLTIKVIPQEDLEEEFDALVFFLSRRYAQHVRDNIKRLIDVKYSTAKVTYDIVHKQITPERLSLLSRNPWKFEKA